ncbi:MAG: homoserine kinase [Chlamydiae bacterium]|nr:homoserine kinase [Chlamydiota bacterium]MBI3267242.1 homoserine kinase [Chlamydiota bacterium]
MAQGFRVKVPASTSNLGSGFDTLGLALEMVNEVEIHVSGKSLSLNIEGEGAGELPENSKNLFIQAMNLVFREVGKSRPKGLQIRMINRIPLARGLGSSAATIISGVVVGKALCRKSLTDNDLLNLALKLEEHPDNLVPALIGGLCLSTLDEEKAVFLGLPLPMGMQVVMVIPDFKLSTKKARAILPKKVPFKDAVFNVGRSSFLTASLIAGRYDLLPLALQDRLHQPYRFEMAPKMKKIFEIASHLCGGRAAMSGAGPSILAFTNHHENPYDVIRALSENLSHHKIGAQVKLLNVSHQGAVVEEM